MKKIFAALGIVAFAVVGCDDSSSASAGQNDEPAVESSSSSVTLRSSSSVRSSSSAPVEDLSSSSEKAKSSSSKNEESSSSVKSSSSSSVILSASEESSSSVVESSSSVAESSSSEVTPQSSSSSADTPSSSSESVSSSSEPVKISSSSEREEKSSSSEQNIESSSSSASEVNCSALLEGETGWSWNVPKECRFNPDIDYGSMTDTRDGKTYKTVKIGDQTWMAENLNYYDATNLSVKEKSWCFGKKDNEDSTTCDVAGRFYTWAAAIDSVKLANDADNPLDCGNGKTCVLPDTVYGICPPGWHLPTLAEWKALFEAVGGRSVAAGVLKSQNGWYSKGNGTDAVGFSAIPVGFRTRAGDYDFEGYFAHFWSASESDEDNAYDVFMNYYIKDVRYDDDVKFYGYSVRCVKNE